MIFAFRLSFPSLNHRQLPERDLG